MSVASSYAQRQRVERHRSLLHDYSAQFGRVADRFAAEAALRLGKEQAEQAARVASDAKDKAEAANRAKSDFLANMSHELRTPLNAIIGFSDIIKEQMLGPVENERYLEYIRDINNSANHLLSVINDILDLSKIEFGNVPLIEENVDLDATIASCLTIIGERARNGGLAVEYKPLKKMPILWAEQRRIKQVLINLLSNAVKFTPSGGGITITLRRERDDGLAIAVSDTGIGIRQEDMAVVMAPFGQVDTGLNRKFEGTGLGLPLTRAFVEMHGGQLTLESALGKGTTATVRLPAKRIQWKAAP
jgi:signal transduction histidine kinase